MHPAAISPLHVTQTGAGMVQVHNPIHYTLSLPSGLTETSYHNAQITNYLTRAQLKLKPPVRVYLRAWVQGELHGTAGFGLWNHPFSPDTRGFRLPQAAWFFHATPPNNMPLCHGVSGHGWKAATLDTNNWYFKGLLPVAPLGVLLMRLPVLYQMLWKRYAQPALRISEQPLDSSQLYHPHEYMLEWHLERVRFWVNGELIHETSLSPRGNLGFIAWVDNQYAVATPQGRFKFGVIGTHSPQALFIRDLHVTNL